MAFLRFHLLAVLTVIPIPLTAVAAPPGDIVIQVNPPVPFLKQPVFERSQRPKSGAQRTSPQLETTIDHATNLPPITALNAADSWHSFNLTVDSARTRPLTLWATHYHVYHAQTIANGQPLLGLRGNRLGPVLSQRDWCYAALQGTVQVTNAQGKSVTYNFAGRGTAPQVNCSAFFSSLSAATLQKVNRVRFEAAKAPYGYGTQGFNLVPYRTIAVDRSQIPIGSVLYIPAAKGKTITLPSGEAAVHDGFFYAADVGSAIKGNHIDVFTGIATQSPFPFITSQSNRTFQAFLIQDADIAQVLQSLHQGR